MAHDDNDDDDDDNDDFLHMIQWLDKHLEERTPANSNIVVKLKFSGGATF